MYMIYVPKQISNSKTQAPVALDFYNLFKDSPAII